MKNIPFLREAEVELLGNVPILDENSLRQCLLNDVIREAAVVLLDLENPLVGVDEVGRGVVLGFSVLKLFFLY
jgi:hypothetical protein